MKSIEPLEDWPDKDWPFGDVWEIWCCWFPNWWRACEEGKKGDGWRPLLKESLKGEIWPVAIRSLWTSSLSVSFKAAYIAETQINTKVTLIQNRSNSNIKCDNHTKGYYTDCPEKYIIIQPVRVQCWYTIRKLKQTVVYKWVFITTVANKNISHITEIAKPTSMLQLFDFGWSDIREFTYTNICYHVTSKIFENAYYLTLN